MKGPIKIPLGDGKWRCRIHGLICSDGMPCFECKDGKPGTTGDSLMEVKDDKKN